MLRQWSPLPCSGFSLLEAASAPDTLSLLRLPLRAPAFRRFLRRLPVSASSMSAKTSQGRRRNTPAAAFCFAASPLQLLDSLRCISTAATTIAPLNASRRKGSTPTSVKQVVHHRDDQRAEQRADDRAAPAGHARAADDDRGNGVHLVAAAGAGVVHGTDARNLHHRRHRHDQPHQRVDAPLNAVDVDARQPRRAPHSSRPRRHSDRTPCAWRPRAAQRRAAANKRSAAACC